MKVNPSPTRRNIYLDTQRRAPALYLAEDQGCQLNRIDDRRRQVGTRLDGIASKSDRGDQAGSDEQGSELFSLSGTTGW